MGIDQDLAALERLDRVAGEMNLVHADGCDVRDEFARVEAVVAAADVDVVDVEQHAAAALERERREELPLWDVAAFELQVAGDVLDQDLPAEEILDLADAPDHVPQRLFGVRQRQQVVRKGAVDRAPAQVLGDEPGLGQVHEPLEAPQVLAIERICRAQRQADAVQAERVELTQLQQVFDLCAAIGEIIFAVRFEPADVGPLAQQVVVVSSSQADPGACRNRPLSRNHSRQRGGHEYLPESVTPWSRRRSSRRCRPGP
jgi:hypothetical protein